MENIDAHGCRMNFKCCSKACIKSNKGGGMKTKICWKSIIFVSPFYGEERKILEQKCPFAVKGHGLSPFFQ